MTMSTTDHELMRLSAQGDAAAFETLVRRWESRLDRVLRRLTSNASDAEDLRQETFVRVLLASPRYSANGAFPTWLYRIAINLARDAARKRKNTAMPDETVPLSGDVPPDVAIEQEERRELIESALRALPSSLREVLVLRHFGDLTFTRISEVLKEPESTIKSRARNALQSLQAELRHRGLTHGDLE